MSLLLPESLSPTRNGTPPLKGDEYVIIRLIFMENSFEE
ncbi:hypothetical protein BN136_3506 [Cronobacter universalis NCTC 9529]|nr:hypothetical protein BN136_3506 [Cronobacter universalis NCTC 9529]